IPKLKVRVRFSTPAPDMKARARTVIPEWALIISGYLQIFRAISGPVTRGGERIRLAVVLGRGIWGQWAVIGLVPRAGRLSACWASECRGFAYRSGGASAWRLCERGQSPLCVA